MSLSGCSRYADFTLPAPEASGPKDPFTWSAMADPVIPRYDAVDVLNPSVVKVDGGYDNFFSQYNGKEWVTRRAHSHDGVNWMIDSHFDWVAAEGGIAANGSVALDRSGFIEYWYQVGSPARIALWTRAGSRGVVLTAGAPGSFDETAVADPDVIPVGNYFYLYYLGQDKARRQRLGVARSRDGLRWEKLRSNPILELGAAGAFDENGLGEPAVWSSGGSYWMLYTGRDRGERRRIGLAKSADGVHWSREADFKPISGDQPWNSAVMCDPSVLVEGNEVRVWFGGGDVPSPDQNLHGQIGLGFLRPR